MVEGLRENRENEQLGDGSDSGFSLSDQKKQ